MLVLPVVTSFTPEGRRIHYTPLDGWNCTPHGDRPNERDPASAGTSLAASSAVFLVYGSKEQHERFSCEIAPKCASFWELIPDKCCSCFACSPAGVAVLCVGSLLRNPQVYTLLTPQKFPVPP